MQSLRSDKHDFPTNGSSNKVALYTPVFLRKAFDMINTCDPSLGCWSDLGTSFVIKQPELFATQVIPAYFAHSNISSFVRQLNFYGFRKIKSDPLRLNEVDMSEESRYWKFGHRFFVQGREDLLSQIKKDKSKSDSTATDKQADLLDDIKTENKELKRKVSALTQDVAQLTADFPTLMQQIESLRKRQRTASHAFTSLDVAQLSTEPTLHQSRNNIQTPLGFNDSQEMDDGSTEFDEDILLSLFDSTEDPALHAVRSESHLPTTVATTNAITPRNELLMDDIYHALSCLPMGLQETFVNRLVCLFCQPLRVQSRTDVVESFRTPATMANQAMALPSACTDSDMSSDDRNRLALLGSAIFDSFLSKGYNDNNNSQIASVGDVRYLESYLSEGTENTLGAVAPSMRSLMCSGSGSSTAVVAQQSRASLGDLL